MDCLMPVDEYINSLQKEVDDILWEGSNTDRLVFLERELKHFLNLQEQGILYEPIF